MSKIIQRIGTTEVKLGFNIKVKNLAMDLKRKIAVYVVLKRESKAIEGKKKVILDPSSSVTLVNETLSMLVTLYRVNKSQKYLEKKAKIAVHTLLRNDKNPKGIVKILGEALFDFSQFAEVVVPVPHIFKLVNCPDKSANLEVEIQATPADHYSHSRCIDSDERNSDDSKDYQN